MIRSAENEDFNRPITDLAALRILALREAYGDVPFIRYYADDSGSLLAIMDGIAYFSPQGTPTEEWLLFLTMEPSIVRLYCSGEIGEWLVAESGWQLHSGVVLKYTAPRPLAQEGICRTPSLPAVHQLLSRCFTALSPLEAWYPDVSHRVRHGCCMLACIEQDGCIVSTAMTVAQAGEHALLGQVATDSNYRRRGYAAACIRDLISRWQGEHLYIIPANAPARKLYEDLGFCPFSTWAELVRDR